MNLETWFKKNYGIVALFSILITYILWITYAINNYEIIFKLWSVIWKIK